MNCYKIKYSKQAIKFMKKNKLYGVRFYKAFSEIAEDISIVNTYDIKKLYDKTYNDVFRLRIGKYRAIFRIINNEILIYVFIIDSRGDVYKD